MGISFSGERCILFLTGRRMPAQESEKQEIY